MNPCPFCEIADGDRHALVVAENDTTTAFLDHRPLFPGHVLIIPRLHHETIEDLPAPSIGPLFETVRSISIAVRTAMKAPGSFIAVNNKISQSVPHLHVHVVPRRPGDGLRGFFWPRNPYTDEEHANLVRDRIVTALTSGEGPLR